MEFRHRQNRSNNYEKSTNAKQDFNKSKPDLAMFGGILVLSLKLNFVDRVNLISFALRQSERHLHELRHLFRNIFLPVKLVISRGDFDVISLAFGMFEKPLLRSFYEYITI